MLAFLLMLVLHSTAQSAVGVGPSTALLAGNLGATPSAASLQACGSYRNQGNPTPAWWSRVRPIVERNLKYFPPGISVPFLGAWIERETDGRYNLVSRLNEVGYFQLHPDEIAAMVGKDKVAAAVAEIKSSPDNSMRWGGRYLSWYDRRLVGLGVRRGTNTYYGLLKAMHWTPTQTPRWIKHVKHAVGTIPESYQGFILVADQIRQGVLPQAPGVTLPSTLPSCSSFFVLARTSKFPARRNVARAFLYVAGAALAGSLAYLTYVMVKR